MAGVCASLSGEFPESIVKKAKDLKVDYIEVRADGLLECTPKNVHQILKNIKKTNKAKIILTVRSAEEGGKFKGSEEDRKKIILGCLHLADLIDIELESEFLKEIVNKAKSNKVGVIISYHDFEKTPTLGNIKKIIKKEAELGADICKAAFMTNSIDDALTVLKATQEVSKNTKVILISMGEKGKITRIAAPIFGSIIAYASAGDKTAPGQLSVKETKTILRILE